MEPSERQQGQFTIKGQCILVSRNAMVLIYLRGPWPAQTHDARMLRESQLMDELADIMPANGASAVYALYGDLAYAQSIYLLGGFRKPPVGSDEALFNRHMSSVRITVEWGFGDIVDKWKFLDFCSAMKFLRCRLENSIRMVHF